MAGSIDYSVSQASNITPPRVGQVLALAVDATSRGYSISPLTFAGQGALQGNRPNQFYLRLFNDGANNVYFAFDSAAVSVNEISDTAITSAGGTLAFDTLPANTCQCDVIGPGDYQDVRIDKFEDVTLIVKCASGKTSTLRIRARSQSMPGITNPY